MRKRQKKKAADAAPKSDPRIEPFEREIIAAERELYDATRSDGPEIEGVQRRTRAAARLWHLRALVLGCKGEHDLAAKASAQAAKHEKVAIDASKATLPDRVAELEQALAQARTRGRGVRELAASSVRRDPPGSRPVIQ